MRFFRVTLTFTSSNPGSRRSPFRKNKLRSHLAVTVTVCRPVHVVRLQAVRSTELRTAECYSPRYVYLPQPVVRIFTTARGMYTYRNPRYVYLAQPAVRTLTTARGTYTYRSPLYVYLPQSAVRIFTTTRGTYIYHSPRYVYLPPTDD